MRKSILFIGMLAVCGGAFAALINDGRYADQDWSADTVITMERLDGTFGQPGFSKNAPVGATWPYVSGGTLKVSMIGATTNLPTAVLTTGSLNDYKFSEATDYIVTTRMKVNQYPDAVSGSSTGINFFDMRGGADRAYIHLESDSIWSYGPSGWAKAADITTPIDTFYTWQFEVSEVVGAGAGTVDIFRRASDLDPWDTVAAGVAIRDQDVNPPQFVVYNIRYNADNTGIQGSITSDYLQIGEAIPEPATLGLIGLSAMLLLGARRLMI